MGRDYHSPCERRVDGDRITELIPAREWLSGRQPGNRGPDTNPLVAHPEGFYPPQLPRHKQRDHLHDRNREHSLYDPANPGLATYVRVTRRRHGNPWDRNKEAELRKERLALREAEVAKEEIAAEVRARARGR